jgi:hypothetical protein
MSTAWSERKARAKRGSSRSSWASTVPPPAGFWSTASTWGASLPPAGTGAAEVAAALPLGLDTPLGQEFHDGSDLSLG